MQAYFLPTEIRIAYGCRNDLAEWLAARGLQRPMLVVDAGLVTHCQTYIASLKSAGFVLQLFTDVEANPRTQTVERLAAQIRDHQCDVVVALGGGSVMDAAKAAAMMANNPGDALDFLQSRSFAGGSLPTVMLPTTCGTGSEVTWVSVLTHEASQRKISIKGRQMFPTLALVDAFFLETLPANLLAWTGMDALTHALEATTGKLANPVSDALAEIAIQLLFDHLPRAYQQGSGDRQALFEVSRAATLAGMAFGNADVAGVHCLSESLGALYDTPHGLANAVLLCPVLKSHRPHIDDRLADLAQQNSKLGANDAEGFLAGLEQLAQTLDIPSFADLKVPQSDYEKIAHLAESNGSNASNPRAMTTADYLAVLADLDSCVFSQARSES